VCPYPSLDEMLIQCQVDETMFRQHTFILLSEKTCWLLDKVVFVVVVVVVFACLQ